MIVYTTLPSFQAIPNTTKSPAIGICPVVIGQEVVFVMQLTQRSAFAFYHIAACMKSMLLVVHEHSSKQAQSLYDLQYESPECHMFSFKNAATNTFIMISAVDISHSFHIYTCKGFYLQRSISYSSVHYLINESVFCCRSLPGSVTI